MNPKGTFSSESLRNTADYLLSFDTYTLEARKAIKLAAKQSAKRTEPRYSFKKSKLKLFDELESTYAAKLSLFEQSSATNTWANDRLCRAAAPLSSSIFLQNEKGPDSLASSRRFVTLDDLLHENVIPDARSRFLYDQVAHKSAKVIARFLVSKYNSRHYYAALIQKNYRIYKFLNINKNYVKERRAAAKKICKMLKNRFFLMRIKRDVRLALKAKVRVIQCIVRRKSAYNKVKLLRQGKEFTELTKLRRWAKKCVQRRRQWRGCLRRQQGELKLS